MGGQRGFAGPSFFLKNDLILRGRIGIVGEEWVSL